MYGADEMPDKAQGSQSNIHTSTHPHGHTAMMVMFKDAVVLPRLGNTLTVKGQPVGYVDRPIPYKTSSLLLSIARKIKRK